MADEAEARLAGVRARAERILRDWACITPRSDESASVQQLIVGDVRGLASDVIALLQALDDRDRALATVAGHDGFWLCWEVDCSCNLCEADRLVARCLGRTHSSDGVPIELAPPQWMDEDEARQWWEAARRGD